MNPFIVAKFGGTSMGTASAMRQAASVVSANSKVKLVVVSATAGTTNQLLSLWQACCNQSLATSATILEALYQKHTQIAQELNCLREVNEAFLSLVEEVQSIIQQATATSQRPLLQDQLLSIGERFSSILFVAALKQAGLRASYFDVRKVLVTDDNFGKAEPCIVSIANNGQQHLRPLLKDNVIVTQGFIGATKHGTTTVLGRGGSDYSAALLAEGLAAEELQIWTDVPGIMTMDPNAVANAKVIPHMSFNEAAELANFGAKVLHPATLWPAIRKNIRVFVASTFSPEQGGTWIYPQVENQLSVRAIALRKNQTLITITSLRMLNAHGFLAKLFGILAHHKLSVDLVTTSEVSVALTIDGGYFETADNWLEKYDAMFAELKEFCEVKIEDHLTLIAIIGNGLTNAAGLSAKTFNAIAAHNVRLICHGASSHNLCFLVKKEEAMMMVEKLHHALIVS